MIVDCYIQEHACSGKKSNSSRRIWNDIPVDEASKIILLLNSLVVTISAYAVVSFSLPVMFELDTGIQYPYQIFDWL